MKKILEDILVFFEYSFSPNHHPTFFPASFFVRWKRHSNFPLFLLYICLASNIEGWCQMKKKGLWCKEIKSVPVQLFWRHVNTPYHSPPLIKCFFCRKISNGCLLWCFDIKYINNDLLSFYIISINLYFDMFVFTQTARKWCDSFKWNKSDLNLVILLESFALIKQKISQFPPPLTIFIHNRKEHSS